MVNAVTQKRGPYAPSLRRREQIAEAVLALVDEVGHDAVTTALIAERAGVSEATVHYHFTSKDHLLVAALEHADRVSSEKSRAVAEPDFDPEVIREISGGVDNRSRLLVMLHGQVGTPGHPAGDYFRRRNEQAVDIFSRIIRRRQREGTALPNLDPERTARQFYAMWEGLFLMAHADGEADYADAAYDGFHMLTGANVMEISAAFLHGGLGRSPGPPAANDKE